jgi:hypothetical protein
VIASEQTLRPPVAEAAPRARAWTRAAGTATLLTAPLVGELLLRLADPTKPGQLLVPGLVYLVACLLFAVLAPATAPVKHVAAASRPRWRSIAAGAALLVGAAGVYLAVREPRQWVLAPIWLLGIALWWAAWHEPSAPGGRRGFAAAAAILLLAGLLRLWSLPDLQPIQIDELSSLQGALEVGRLELDNPRGLPLFAADHGLYSQIVLQEYIGFAFFPLGGINVLTLRMPGVVVGLITIALVFLLGRELYSTRVGLIAALLLTTLTAHLNFTRSGDRPVDAELHWVGVAYFLARGLSRRSVPSLAIAGLWMGHTLYTYWSARPSFAFVLAVLVAAALDRRLRGRWLLGGALAVVAGFLVGTGPMLAAYLKDPSIFLFNTGKASWLSQAIAQFRETGDLAKLLPLWQHFYVTLLGYNLVGSVDNHYLPGRGIFLPLPAALLFGGLAYATLRFRDWRLRHLAIWFWGTSVSLSMLADVQPVMHRLQPVLPAAVLLVALALDRLLIAWRALGPRAGRVSLAVAGVALVGTMAQESAFYFGDYARRDFDRWQDGLVRTVLAAPRGEHFVIVPGASPMGMPLFAGGQPFEWASNLQRRVTGENLSHAVEQLPDLGARQVGTTFLVHSEQLIWLDTIRAVYPRGRAFEVRTQDPRSPDALAWSGWAVAADQIAGLSGLRLSARDAAGQTRQRDVLDLTLGPGDLGDGLSYPIDLEWRGWVRTEPKGPEPAAIVSSGTVHPRLRLGDLSVDLTAARRELRLETGAHPLVATARLAGPNDRVDVRWDALKRGDPRPFPQGQSAIWPGQPRVVVDWLTAAGDRTLRREYDVMVADGRLHLRRPGPTAQQVRWSGTLRIDQPARYEFELISEGPVRLWIGDRVVWPPAGDRPARPNGPPNTRRAALDLPAGPHGLRVDRELSEAGSVILLWRRGADPFGIVPMESFEPIRWPQ